MTIEQIFQEMGRMHLEITELRTQKTALEVELLELASVRKTDEPPKPEPS